MSGFNGNKRYHIGLIALFLSGAGSLILEVVWVRLGVLLFGTTTQSASVILGIFMGGLALGSFISGKILPKIRSPWVGYALLEMGSAFLALALAFFAREWGTTRILSPWTASLLLLIPTTLMGMTVPFVISGLRMELSRASSLAYGINTLGASLGALLGAFLVLPQLGLFHTQILAAVLLVIAALMALVVRMEAKEAGMALEQRQSSLQLKTSWIYWAMAGWGGLSSLALEICWTRLLGLLLGPSVFALGIVLFSYLCGMALGALWQPTKKISVILLALVFSLIWSISIFGLLPYLFLELVQRFHPGMWGLWGIEALLSFFLLLPSALSHGMLLPVLMKKSPSYVLGWNTLGCIVGSVATGLWLAPKFGFLPVLLAIFVVHFILLMGILWRRLFENTMPRKVAVMTGFGIFALVFVSKADQFWDRSVIASGVYKYAVGHALVHDRATIEVGKLLYYREGISSTVAVIETPNDIVLSIDGKADASAHGDLSTQVLLAALPLSVIEKAHEVLVVGFASGVTAGVGSLFPNAKVTSVEIEPAVYEAATFFTSVNHGPLSSPHQLRVADARNFLLKSDKKYDVITSEPSNPWMSGVAPLFTYEFFTLAKENLSEGGVMCQWLPIYGMSPDLVRSVFRTFSSVYPYVDVYESVRGYDLLLLGSRKPLQRSASEFERRWSNDDVRRDLKLSGIVTGADMVARFLMGQKGVERMSSEAMINTDDNGFMEYRAPLSLHLKTAERNHQMLLEIAKETEGPLP